MDSRSCWVLWWRAGQDVLAESRETKSVRCKSWDDGPFWNLMENDTTFEVFVFQRTKHYSVSFAARSEQQRNVLCRAGGVLSGYFPCLLCSSFLLGWQLRVLGTHHWLTSSSYVSCTDSPTDMATGLPHTPLPQNLKTLSKFTSCL